MNTVIFSNDLRQLKRAMARQGGCSWSCLPLDECGGELSRLLDYLRSHRDVRLTSPGNDLSAVERKDFHREFAALMGRLNTVNRSFDWWAFRFSNKSPLASELYTRVVALVRIRRFIASCGQSPMIVLSGDDQLPRLCALLRGWPRVRMVRACRNRQPVLGRNVFVRLGGVFLRACLRALLCAGPSPAVRRGAPPCTTVFSLLNRQSFAGEGDYRDAYFGSFVQRLAERGTPYVLVLLGISNDCIALSHRLKRAYPHLRFMMVERCLGLSGAFSCLCRALAAWFKPVRVKGDAALDGMDLSPLLLHAIRDEHRSGAYFHSLCMHQAMRRLCLRVSLERFYYPFENRAFEKMIVLALRKYAASARLIGYQHAALSRFHANFMVSADEAKVLPLPDTIVAMGEETAALMTDYGGLPKEMVRPLCALRYESTLASRQRNGQRMRSLLVVLSAGMSEYCAVLGFLRDAFEKGCPYSLWIRPHPSLALAPALALTGPLHFTFYCAERETAGRCLDWADLVIDVSSTLGLEALCAGLPVIHVDLPFSPRFDPLAVPQGLETVVSSPGRLAEAISSFEELSPEEFQRRRERAFDFSRRYFAPVNDQTLDALARI